MIIYDFYADWCGPCHMMDPVIKDVMRDYPYAQLMKVDVELNPTMASEYKVSSIPTLVFMKDGAEVHRLNGFASKAAIVNVLEKFKNI